jgi:streptogramin lyase
VLSLVLSGKTPRKAAPRRRPAFYRPWGESLEDRCLPAVTILEYPVPAPNNTPDFITAGPDNNLWFGEHYAPVIERITPQGAITPFSLPFSPGQDVAQIISGPNNNLWFVVSNPNATDGTPSGTGEVVEMTTAGTVVQTFSLANVSSAICLTEGPDGNLWFADYYSGTSLRDPFRIFW